MKTEKEKACLRGWYKRNKVRHRVAVAARRQELKKWVRGLKLAQGCVECGYRHHHAALHFDHVRGSKIADVQDLVHRGYGKKVILREVAKCEIVCANCHAVRTYRRAIGLVA